jgi:hypothetical protein
VIGKGNYLFPKKTSGKDGSSLSTQGGAGTGQYPTHTFKNWTSAQTGEATY